MLAVINDTGIIVVIVAFMVLFGAGQLPKAARHLAEARREIRKAGSDLQASDPTDRSLSR